MKIILEGNPLSTSHIYQRGKGKRLFMIQEAKNLKESYSWQAKSQYREKPMIENLAAYIKLYFGDKRRRDEDNYKKLVYDSLQGIIFEDDKQIILAETVKLIDEKKPRVEIDFYKFA